MWSKRYLQERNEEFPSSLFHSFSYFLGFSVGFMFVIFSFCLFFPAGDCWTSCCRPEGNQLWRTQWHSSKVPGQPKPLFHTGQSFFSRKLARLMCGTQRYVGNALYQCCKFEQTAWMIGLRTLFCFVSGGKSLLSIQCYLCMFLFCNIGQRRKSRAFLSCSSDLLDVFLYVQVSS